MKFLSLNTVGGVLVFAGVVLAGVSGSLKLAPLMAGGIALLGAGAFVLGLQAVVSGEWKIMRRRRGHSAVARASYSGFQARLIGVLIMLFGAGFVGLGLWQFSQGIGNSSDAPQSFMHSDLGLSLAIIGLGIVACIWGVVSLLGSDEQNRSAGAILLSLPLRLFAVVFVLIGIAAVGYGGARIFAPQAIDAALAAFGLSGQ